MAINYIQITKSDFDSIFKESNGWSKILSGESKEIIFVKTLKSKPNMQVMVYSSILKNTSLSRGCGKDAIRVCAINTLTSRGVRKGKRINRTSGWDSRLKTRVVELWDDLKQSNL